MGQPYIQNTYMDYIESLRLKGLSENTILSYQRDIKKFLQFCEKQGIDSNQQVTETFVRKFLMVLEQEENQRPATLARCITSLRLFYQYLLSQGYVARNPMEQIQLPKVMQGEPRILTMEEVNRLLQQAHGMTPKAQRDSAMLELLYATGIRVSELVHLKLQDINLDMEYLMCQQKHQGRVIPFGKTAKKALGLYLAEARPLIVKDGACDYLFTNLRGQPLTRQGVWKLLRKYGQEAGIDGEITPHTLRHSFAAHLVHNGADLFSVQEMMGFTNIAGTQVYAKMRPASIREAYTKAKIRE